MITLSEVVEEGCNHDLFLAVIELVDSPPRKLTRQLAKELERKSGVYRVMLDGAGWADSVYVGQSSNLGRRLKELLSGSRESHVLNGRLNEEGIASPESFLQRKCYIQVKEVPNDNRGRRFLESLSIALLHPKYNR